MFDRDHRQARPPSRSLSKYVARAPGADDNEQVRTFFLFPMVLLNGLLLLLGAEQNPAVHKQSF